MSRTHVSVLLALLVLVLPASTALAQVFPYMQGGQSISKPGRVGDAAMCQGTSGGSRMRPNCDPEKSAPTERPAKISLDAPAAPSEPQCEATTLTNYAQRNTVARVDGTISLRNCKGGSTGTFDIVVRIKDESGEIKSLEFSDNWQRSDDQDVKFAADYPIGENVDLLNVRLRDLRCTCGDRPPTVLSDATADAPPDPPPEPPNKN